MQNRKVQMWAISGYDVKIAYIKGFENTCADMFSRINHPPLTKEEEMLIDNQVDIGDNTYEIGVVNINRINPKHHVCNTQPPSDKTITRPTLDYDNLDMS
jgi:hypothetical protein